MKYIGKRTPEGCTVSVQGEIGRHPLPRCNAIRNHSPDGFEWGYGGSGPAQLALALCVHALGGENVGRERERALAIYQDFKWKFIATLPRDTDWEFTLEQVQKMIAIVELEQERAKRIAQAEEERAHENGR